MDEVVFCMCTVDVKKDTPTTEFSGEEYLHV